MSDVKCRNLKQNKTELKLSDSVCENVKNFELRFNDYYIQAHYRGLANDPATDLAVYYNNPLLKISALPDEVLSVLRYITEPQIPSENTW